MNNTIFFATMDKNEVVVFVARSDMPPWGTEFAWLSEGTMQYFSKAPNIDDFGLGSKWRNHLFDHAKVPGGFIFDGKKYYSVKEADDSPLCNGEKRYVRIQRVLQARYDADSKFRLILAAIKKTGKTLMYFEGFLPNLGDEIFYETWGVYLRWRTLMRLVG